MAARFYNQLFNSTVDSSYWTEDWTLLSNSDGIHFRMTWNNHQTETNSYRPQYATTVQGINVFSASGNNRRSQINMHRLEDVSDRDGWTQTSTAGPTGPGFIDGGTGLYHTTEVTNSSGILTLQRTANDFALKVGYMAMAMVGSFQAFTNVGTNIPANNVGSYYTCSVGFVPDLVFLNRAYNQVQTDPTLTGGVQASWRVWDARSFALAQYGTDQFGDAYSFTTVGYTAGYMVSRSSWYDNGAQDSNFRGNVKLVNSFDNQFYCYIFSHAGTTHTFAPRYTAIKWLDDTVHRIGHTTIGSSLATRSVQTNSMYINFIMAFATGNPDYDEPVPADVTTRGQMSRAFWTRSGGSTSHNVLAGIGPVSNAPYIIGDVSSYFATAYKDEATAAINWQIYSVDAGSGGWSYTVNASTDFADGILDFLAIGEPINAPDHLTGPDGESIFLADQSDYFDNLLLLGGGGPVTYESGLEFGIFNGSLTTVGSTVWYESYPGLTELGRIRLMAMQGYSTLNSLYLRSYGGISLTSIYSINGGDAPSISSNWRKDSTDRDQYIANEANGVDGFNWIEPVLQSSRVLETASVQVNTIGVYQGNSGADFDASVYSALVIAGSVTADYNESNFNTNTPAHHVVSLDNSPDLIFTLMTPQKTTVGYNTLMYTVNGYTDMRSGANRYRTNAWATGYSTTDLDYGTFTLCPSNGFVSPYNAQRTLYMEYNSVDANGHALLEVKSNATGLSANNYTVYGGLKFAPGTGIYVGRGNAGSTVATRSFQCNSVKVEFLWVTWTDANTRPEAYGNGVYSYSNLGHVMWVQSGGKSHASIAIDGGGVAGEASLITNSADMLVYDPAYTTQRWHAYSMDAGSNGWHATFATSTQVPDSQINYLAIGAAMPAPAHLMGADGQSIFLADDTENWDNLLLTGAGVTEPGSTPVSSEGPAGPAPLFRKFPTTEDQQFPTPIYEIRKFPSE